MKPKLFDGDTLCIKEVRSNSLICTIVPYRFVFALTAKPILRSCLDLTIVAVSGITFLQDQVFWGERSEHVTQYPKHKELIPSGSITVEESPINFVEQLLSELSEESNIRATDVVDTQPFLLVMDSKNRVIDVCCKILLNNEINTSEILQNFSAGEYSMLHSAPIPTLKQETIMRPEAWVPTSIAILNSL